MVATLQLHYPQLLGVTTSDTAGRWVHVTHGLRASDGLTGPGGSASTEAPSSGARPRLIPHQGPPARVASHGSWLPPGPARQGTLL